MKKTFVAMLAFLLVFCMLFAGCGKTDADTQVNDASDKTIVGDVNTDVEPIDVRIAFVCWSYGDNLSIGYQKALLSLSKGLMTLDQPINVTWEWITALDPDEMLTNIEAVMEKDGGLDGVIAHYMTQASIDAFTEYGIPFAGYTVFAEEIEDYAANSPYYVGTIHEDFAGQSERQVEAMLAAGCKEIAVIGPAPGLYNHDVRFDTYNAIFAEHPEVIYYETRSDNLRADILTELFNLHPNIDGIIDTSALLNGCGDTVVQTIRVNGGNVKYATCDFTSDQVSAMEDGTIIFTSSGTGGSVTHVFVALMNQIMGTPLSDKGEVFDWAFVDIASVDDYNNFQKYCAGDVPMITFEEYKPFFKWENPDANIEDYKTLAAELTLEGIVERHAYLFEE